MKNKGLKLAELTNGRLAMIGISLVAITELITGNGLITMIYSSKLDYLWWALGIYAS